MVGPRIACYPPARTDASSVVLPTLSDGQVAIEDSLLPGWLGTGYRGNTCLWPLRSAELISPGNGGHTPTRSIGRGVESVRAASGDDRSTASADDADAQVAPGARVRVHPGTDTESFGVIVADFGEMASLNLCVGQNQIANSPRRWAVLFDDTLVFVDSDQMPLVAADLCALL
jgi:hypothetical protein